MQGHGVPATTTTTNSSQSTNSPITSSTSSHASISQSWKGRWTSTGERQQTAKPAAGTMPASGSSNWMGMSPSSSTRTPTSSSTMSTMTNVSNPVAVQRASHHQHNMHQQLQRHDSSLQDDGFKRPAIPNTVQTSATSQPPSKDFTAEQLLQFVGLPTNLANQLAPPTFEQKRRMRQKPFAVPTINMNSLDRANSHSASTSQVKQSTKLTPVIPKPGAPLPANLVDDIPVSGVLNNHHHMPSPSII